MKKFLEELYYGELNIFEKPRNLEYIAKSKELVELENLFLGDLSDKKQEEYENLQDARANHVEIHNVQLFSDAFRLGARMMLEIMLEDEG